MNQYDTKSGALSRTRRTIVRAASAPILRIAASLLVAAALGACATTSPGAESTLYRRLGGEPGVARVVGRYVDDLASDPHTRRTFDKVDLNRVKRQLALFLCAQTGGGCLYDDDDVRTVHAGMGIRESEFYAGVESLAAILDEERVPMREKNELLAILAPMKKDVVEP